MRAPHHINPVLGLKYMLSECGQASPGVQLERILGKRMKAFLCLAWCISVEIRQSQGSLVSMDVLPSINVSCHIMEQMEENVIRLVTAKNQGAFDTGIWNKWKLCLKAHSCSSFAIFFISSSVRTLSCWDNWEGFHISASSRITDVGCVNKGKHSCTSYLMPSSLDVKEYCGKPFNTTVLFLTTPTPNPHLYFLLKERVMLWSCWYILKRHFLYFTWGIL